MLIIFDIGIFGSSLSAVEARFHMISIIQCLCFICISRSNGLVTVEVKIGSVLPRIISRIGPSQGGG